MERALLAYIYSILMNVTRLAVTITTPLLLDSITPYTMPLLNITGETPIGPDATPSWQRIDPLVQISVSMGLDSLLLGVAVIIMLLIKPGSITEYDRRYPKRRLAMVGFAQSVSALMFQYSSPGNRTAPYLQAFLGNLSIPFAFALRYLILRKRPTRLKFICAAVVLISGMVSLLPVFFPSMESKHDRDEEGGATGAWRVVWPLIFIFNSIPHSISNIILERSVKDKEPTGTSKEDGSSRSDEQHPGILRVNSPGYGSVNNTSNAPQDNTEHSENHAAHQAARSTTCTQSSSCHCEVCCKIIVQNNAGNKPRELNMLYTLFWTFTSTFVGTMLLFWVDFIPGFGMQSNIKEFLPQVAFNLRCILGMSEVCGVATISLAWARMVAKTISFTSAALMLRYGEGANFYTLISVSQSPIRLVFWSLFEEHPFRWRPIFHLSSWLAIGAIIVQIPTIVLYERSAPEISDPTKERQSPAATDETTPLMSDGDSSGRQR